MKTGSGSGGRSAGGASKRAAGGRGEKAPGRTKFAAKGFAGTPESPAAKGYTGKAAKGATAGKPAAAKRAAAVASARSPRPAAFVRETAFSRPLLSLLGEVPQKLAVDVLRQVKRLLGEARGRPPRLVVSVASNRPAERPATESNGEAASVSTRHGDALLAARERGQRRAIAILDADDMLPADAVAERLRSTPEEVAAAADRGELLVLSTDGREKRFPAWQFVNDRPLRPLPELQRRLGNEWAVFRFLRQHHPELDGRTGLDAVADPRTETLALEVAASQGFGPAGL